MQPDDLTPLITRIASLVDDMGRALSQQILGGRHLVEALADQLADGQGETLHTLVGAGSALRRDAERLENAGAGLAVELDGAQQAVRATGAVVAAQLEQAGLSAVRRLELLGAQVEARLLAVMDAAQAQERASADRVGALVALLQGAEQRSAPRPIAGFDTLDEPDERPPGPQPGIDLAAVLAAVNDTDPSAPPILELQGVEPTRTARTSQPTGSGRSPAAIKAAAWGRPDAVEQVR